MPSTSRTRALARGLLLSFLGCASGCTGFQFSQAPDSRFVHSIVVPTRAADADPLHIYIAGDGRPFLQPSVVAADPSVRKPLALALMAKDPHSAFLGRPCYHGRFDDPYCDFRKWTLERYSAEIVTSMVTHARLMLGDRRVVLIGHSGGGTLALLMAARMTESVDAVITVAGNLDVAGWTTHHGYTPLSGSLDPRLQAPLPPQIKQVHLVGFADQQVPASLADRYLSKNRGARLCSIVGVDHASGWLSRWSQLLDAALRGDCPG